MLEFVQLTETAVHG